MEEFELALDDCLRQLTSGRASLAQCLAQYPKQAAELRPLLEAALRLRQGKGARPSSAARDRTRAKLADFIESHPRQPRNVKVVPRLAFAMLSILLAFALAGTALAQAALPGQSLYLLKLSTERVWRAAAPDPVAVDIQLADRRANEIVSVAGKKHTPMDGEQQTAEDEGIAAYNDVLDRLAEEANGPDSEVILTVLEAHQQKLLHAGVHVPKLDNIVSRSKHGQGQGPNNKP